MTRVIPIRLDNDVIGFIDMLVELGIYSSRSEALRDLIKMGMEEFGWIAKVEEAVEKLFKLEEETGSIPIRVEGALEQLLKERSRL